MSRKKTGTIVTLPDGRMQAVISLKDGTRKRLPPFPKGTSRAMALERTALHAERAIAKGTVGRKRSVPSPRESGMARWFGLWASHREARGYTAVRENRSHFALHIQPAVGELHIKNWTRDDMRRLSAALDAKVQAGELSWKMAWNIWGTATKMCDDAAEAKSTDIRCRTDNPARGVRGPERGDSKSKEFLYPSEFLQFMQDETVPLAWRQIVGVAIYTYMRAGELRVLRWEDVDLEHNVIHVHRAFDRTNGREKGTKGKAARKVPIEPALLPMLEAMHTAAQGRGLVLQMPDHSDLARILRHWLQHSKVSRAGLHAATETRRHVVFHDLRGTGCTWAAVRGDDALKIQSRAGHRGFATTQSYIAAAEMVRDQFGNPFPDLPAGLNRSAQWIGPELSVGENSENWRPRRDLNPCYSLERAVSWAG